MVHEATEQRKEEHQEFVDEFATTASAIRLIGKAKQRLEKFYSPNKFAKEKKAVEEAALKKAGLSLLHGSSSQAAVNRAAASLLQGAGDLDSFIQRQALRIR